jgi:N-acetylglucosamine kinase-like BadF-type ATPase
VSVVLGIDIGGSGSRIAMRGTDPAAPDRVELAGGPVGVEAGGSTVRDVVVALLREAAAAWPGRLGDLAAVGIGATGLATLVDRPGELIEDVRATASDLFDRQVPVVAAIDAVTAHLGALRGEAGAVVALGTGAIAFGTDGDRVWRRVDGWGHLLGDRGGGAWIGRSGLEVAVRAHDGVDASGAALLDAARARFGEPLSWPGQLYTRADRAGVLASFAADVARCAADGDAAAAAIMAGAGREAAGSAVAALGSDLPPVVAATGGVFAAAGVLTEVFRETLVALRPDVSLRPPAGDPLDGALVLAGRAAAGTLAVHEPYVWLAGPRA